MTGSALQLDVVLALLLGENRGGVPGRGMSKIRPDGTLADLCLSVFSFLGSHFQANFLTSFCLVFLSFFYILWSPLELILEHCSCFSALFCKKVPPLILNNPPMVLHGF